jgi:hypothetical protein
MIKSRMSWMGHLARIVEMRNPYKVLIEKPERKMPLGRPRHRYKYNIKVNIGEIGCEGMDYRQLISR